MLDGRSGSVEQDAADVGAAVRGSGAAAGLAAVAGVRRQTDEGGDLLAGDQAELGQLSDQGTGGDRSDAAQGLQQAVSRGHLGMAGDVPLDLAFDGAQAGLDGLDQGLQAAPDGGVGSDVEPATLGVPGVDCGRDGRTP
mgnify:CR=1 FL=1